MKNLLIHCKNTSLVDLAEFKENNIVFKIPDDLEVDRYMTNLIDEQIVPSQPDAIFIKYALENDYIAFLGLRLGYHIRLYQGDKKITDIPLIFVGEETITELIRLSHFTDILGTEGTYFIKEELHQAKTVLQRVESGQLSGCDSSADFLNRITIQAPRNYDTRHSFINELSLYLWSRYIGNQEAAEQVKKRVENNLYFKYKINSEQYLKEQEQITELPVFEVSSKILLIDDEAEKGWETFYEHLFSRSEKKVEFKSLNVSRNSSTEDVLVNAESAIREFNPDVILLDLRLTEQDVFEKDPKKLTGYSILKKIKTINRGTQVVVTSASNKSVVFRDLLNAGADNYVLKNAEAIIGTSSLIEAIKLAINEAKILKPIHTSLSISIDAIRSDQLKKLDVGEDSDYYYEELKSELISYLSLVQELLTNRNNTDRFSITLLQMHKCLEVITDYYIESLFEKSSKPPQYEFYTGEHAHFFSMDDGNNIKVIKWKKSNHMSIVQKFFNTYHYFTNRPKSSLFVELKKLNKYRNSYSHPNLDRDFTSLEALYEDDFKSFRKSFIRVTSAFFEFFIAIR
ncbi:MAG: hypothetical protein WEA58_10820 [Balneolaceae bacterium]